MEIPVGGLTKLEERVFEGGLAFTHKEIDFLLGLRSQWEEQLIVNEGRYRVVVVVEVEHVVDKHEVKLFITQVRVDVALVETSGSSCAVLALPELHREIDQVFRVEVSL